MEAVREAIMVERSRGKRQRIEQAPASDLGAFEGAALLPQELILSVLAAVSASADKPADFFSAMLTYVMRDQSVSYVLYVDRVLVLFGKENDARVPDGIDHRRCKKFMMLGEHRQVRKVASELCVAVRAASCGDAGNPDTNYLLSMILFYCLAEGHQGWSRMMKAARSSHAEAIYALAIIRLNGSGGITVDDRGQHAAAHLCKAAANLCHIGALCELGNCVSRCLGVPKNIANGRRLILRANLQELCAKYPPGRARAGGRPRSHPQWQLPQALHWRMGHKEECIPVQQWLLVAVANANAKSPMRTLLN
ncbi:F-box protein At1g67340-like [Phragmites australis]|uniref:F-box protein At1g67340-like n=1 Tax=Phragmites australis TaxID=29695 RepID=UPI002D791128|nr:F-box protein At1g67340-like [Phragmites australis]